MGEQKSHKGKHGSHSLPDPNGQESPMFPSPDIYPINRETGKRRCLWCGKDIEHKRKNPFCGNTCRPYYTAWAKLEAERVAKEIDRRNKRHDRKCTKCGRPCWPNYFFCKECQPEEGYGNRFTLNLPA